MKFSRLACVVCVLVVTVVVAKVTTTSAVPIPCDNPCAADPKWFPATPKPTFQKPNPDSDCDFYRPAWQYLLYLIQEETPGSGPRLFTLDHPDDLFSGSNVSRFPVAKKGILRLAPRVALNQDPLTGAEINQAGSTGILVDPKTGRAVYYGVHLNETFSQFIRQNKYDKVLNLKTAPPDQEFPRGSAEFKTSWRILAKDDPGDGYITTTATISKLTTNAAGKIVIDPTATEPDKKVALLGIHVVFVLDGHPEFIWATFEHNNNAPELNPKRVETPPGAAIDATPVDNAKDWSLYRKGTAANKCNKNNKGVLTLNADQTLTPETYVFRQFHFGNDDEPCVIETLNQSVNDGINASLPKVTNADAKKRLEALKNYSLRGAMWLNNPAYFREGIDFALLDEQDPKKKILGGDPQLSNAVIETFTQPWKPMVANSRQSNFCFDCHRTMAQSLGNATLPALRLNVSQTLVQRYLLAATEAP